MSQYTTGELAKQCDITVRTVQFYDQKGILVPSALTEGGRRLYSDEDLRKMKIICFLRDIGLSLDTIGQLLKEEDPGSVIYVILQQQEQLLQDEINEHHEKLDRIAELKKSLKDSSSFSIQTIGDMAVVMEGKKNLSALRKKLFMIGIPATVLEWASILLWIFTGIWWPFAVLTFIGLFTSTGIAYWYTRKVAYICPQCHETFKPVFKEALFSKHSKWTRKLTCTKCGHHGFCVETWGGEAQ